MQTVNTWNTFRNQNSIFKVLLSFFTQTEPNPFQGHSSPVLSIGSGLSTPSTYFFDSQSQDLYKTPSYLAQYKKRYHYYRVPSDTWLTNTITQVKICHRSKHISYTHLFYSLFSSSPLSACPGRVCSSWVYIEKWGTQLHWQLFSFKEKCWL